MKKVIFLTFLILCCVGSVWGGELEDILKNAEQGYASSQLQVNHPDEKHKTISPAILSTSVYEPMIYDYGWKALGDRELTKRMQKPVININTDEPFNFKVLDKKGNKAGRVNTPAEYLQHMREGNSIDINSTYGIINDGLYRRAAMPLLYLSKAKQSKYSYVGGFPFDGTDPLLMLPVSFISWYGSDQEEVVNKAFLENKSWRRLSPNVRILSSSSNELSVYDTFAEDMYKLSGEDLYTGDQPSHIINPVLLGDLNNDGYEDIVLFYAYYYVSGSGRYYRFKVLTRKSKNSILEDITDDVGNLIWKD